MLVFYCSCLNKVMNRRKMTKQTEKLNLKIRPNENELLTENSQLSSSIFAAHIHTLSSLTLSLMFNISLSYYLFFLLTYLDVEWLAWVEILENFSTWRTKNVSFSREKWKILDFVEIFNFTTHKGEKYSWHRCYKRKSKTATNFHKKDQFTLNKIELHTNTHSRWWWWL